MTLEELMTVAADSWTPSHDEALETEIRHRLPEFGTLTWEARCSTKEQARHWGRVSERVVRACADVVHTGGASWDGRFMTWNMSPWRRSAGVITPRRAPSAAPPTLQQFPLRKAGELVPVSLAATEPHGFDWTADLTPMGQFIGGSEWWVEPDDGLVTLRSQAVLEGVRTGILRSGGQQGKRYTITNRITTPSGFQLVRSFAVRVT